MKNFQEGMIMHKLIDRSRTAGGLLSPGRYTEG